MNDTVTSEIVVPANHPSLAGHFPGQPVVPAVVLLDAVVATIRTRRNLVLRSIPSVKFREPVLPNERVDLRIDFTEIEAGQIRANFEALRTAVLVFEGSFILSAGSKP